MMIKSNFISYFLKGLAIGTAAIIPGISGGTIAFMLGIYDQIIDAIVSIRQHTKQSLNVLISELEILIGSFIMSPYLLTEEL
jgi:uncharacterized membrane protein